MTEAVCLLQVYGSADHGSLYSLTVNVDASSAELDQTEQAALKSIYTKYAVPPAQTTTLDFTFSGIWATSERAACMCGQVLQQCHQHRNRDLSLLGCCEHAEWRESIHRFLQLWAEHLQ